MSQSRPWALALALSLMSACRTVPVEPKAPPLAPPAPAKPAPLHLTLIGTNDLHGWAKGQKESFAQGELRFGGLASFASYVKVLRAENPGGVVLLDAGDLFQGTLMSNLTEGAVVVDAFNLLGYDAAAIGNHEFDYGPVGPVAAATTADLDPFGALKARMAQAKFPLLSANITLKATGERPAWLTGDGTVLLERQGVKVGVIGLTTPQTPTVTLPINVASLTFEPLAREAQAAAKRLRARGAEVVLVTVHGGGKCAHVEDPHDATSCDLENGEVFEMLNALPAGTIDAVVAGHTHAQIGHFINGTPVIESGALGKYFGVIDLFVDPETHKVLPDRTSLRSGLEICETVEATSGSCEARKFKGKDIALAPATFHGQPVPPDAEVLAVLAPAEQQVAELQSKDLGVAVPADLGRHYEAESALGSLLADALRALTKADVAMLNPGGLRADLRKGELTYGAVYEVLPFDNTVATLEVTSEQLGKLLNVAYASRKGVFQVSGVEVTLATCPGPDRFKGFTVGGKPAKKTGRYKVVMPDFLARGGDGLGPALASVEKDKVDLGDNRGTNIRDELVAYWRAKKLPLVAPKPGRVAFVDSGSACGPGAKLDTQTQMP